MILSLTMQAMVLTSKVHGEWEVAGSVIIT
jgi:hypothetical protein